MWTQQFSNTSTADVSRLWQLLADLDGWARWNAGVERITLDGPLTVGASFDMTLPDQDAPIRSTIIALQEPERLTDHTDFEGMSVTVEHRLSPGADSRTTVTFTISVNGDAPDTVLADIGREVSADFPTVIASLIALAEQEG